VKIRIAPHTLLVVLADMRLDGWGLLGRRFFEPVFAFSVTVQFL